MGVVWKSLEEWATESNKQSLRVILMWAQETDENAISKGQTEEVSDGNEDCVGNYTKGYPCYTRDKEFGYIFSMP